MFAEYEHPLHRGDPKSFTFGPLAQTEFGEIAGFGAMHTLNLLFTRTVGNNRTDATRAIHRLAIAASGQSSTFQPGFEYYGQIDEILNPGKPAQQLHGLGPVLVGREQFCTLWQPQIRGRLSSSG